MKDRSKSISIISISMLLLLFFLLIALYLSSALQYKFYPKPNFNYADEVSIEYERYDEPNLVVNVTDEVGFNALKTLRVGEYIPYTTNCGIGNAKIIYKSRDKVLTLYIARDDCETLILYEGEHSGDVGTIYDECKFYSGGIQYDALIATIEKYGEIQKW